MLHARRGLDPKGHQVKKKNPSMSYATIVVPHIHPGKERYGARSVTLNAILDLTWTITLIICEVAIRKAQTGRYNERKALLDEIWPLVDASSARVVERLEKRTKSLKTAKKELSEYRQERLKRQPKRVTVTANESLSEAARAWIAEYG